MPAKFALPILHFTSGDYLLFYAKLMLGREYFQPVATLKLKEIFPGPVPPAMAAQAEDFVTKVFAPGIEMFFDSSNTEVSKVYAMFDGHITWKDEQLIFTPDPKVLSEYAKHVMVEAPLGRVIYHNLEKASVKTALIDLILNSFQATPKVHPILKGGVISDIGPVMGVYKSIDALLQAQAPPPSPVTVEPIIDTFLAGGHKLQVLAGDMLGKANFFQATDELPPATGRPSWFKTIADADRARRVLIVTKDIGRQVINPWYYLHQYKSSTNVTLTSILPSAHPLLMNTTPPAYGRRVANTTYCFPLGDLNSFHRFPDADPDSLAVVPAISTNEWRYDDASLFEATTRVAGATVPFTIPSGASQSRKIQSMKTLYLTLLNDYCQKLQVPVELMMGIVGAESTGTTTGDVRLEPLKNENETQLKTTTLFHTYNKFTGFHCKANHVVKEGDSWKFLIEKTEKLKGISINVALNVNVPMRLYYDKDKHWLMRKQSGIVLNPIEIKSKKVLKTGFTGKQAFGQTQFYRINKVDVANSNLSAVEFVVPEATILQLDMKATESIFKKTPTINGDTIITVWKNGVESDLTFTIAKGNRKIDPNDLLITITVSAGDKLALSVETDGTAGEIEGLTLRFQQASIWVKIPKSQNDKNPLYNEIQRYSAGMLPAGSMPAATTLYFPIGVNNAGATDRKTVAALIAPGDGFLVIADLYVNSNSLTKDCQVTLLRKDGDKFQPTGIVATIPPFKTKFITVPTSEKVKKNEEFIIEITTAADLTTYLVTPGLGGVTMSVYFIPFNDDEAFLTTRNGFSFDILTMNRTVRTAAISAENGRTMTWNDLDEWIRKTKGSRISVGPVQTLISTADNTIKKATTYINMLIPPLTLTDIALFLDHLSDPQKALAIGVALIRWQYNFPPDKKDQNQSTRFDLPLVASVHNAQRSKNRIKENKRASWGLVFANADKYIQHSAAIFNIAQKSYNKTNFIPTVQFKK